MRYPQLARWLETAGYRYVRCTGSHRIFRDGAGHVLTIAGGNGHKQYSRAELAPIWREVRQHQTLVQTSYKPSAGVIPSPQS